MTWQSATEHRSKILFIDDDEGLQRLVARDLGRHGYEVRATSSALEGVRLMGEQAFDAIVLDHVMPEQDGITTLAAVQALADPPPAIYLTGTDETRVAVAALKAGAADYVIKDVGGTFLPLLRRAIDVAIRRTAMRRENEAALEAVREARDRAEALLREVNHRVGNSLQLVASLVRLQANAIKDGGLRHTLIETENRIMAVAQVHRRLYTSDDVRFVDAEDYMSGLTQELADSMQGPPVRLNVSPARLRTDRAVSIGVIVSELVTNAYKYAYADRDAGEIRVSLTPSEEPNFTLVVEDDGVGYAVDGPPRGSGMGSKIVRTLAQTLGSSLAVRSGPNGTRIEMNFAP